MQYKIDQEKKEFIFTNEFPMLSAGEPYFVVVNKGELSLSAEGVEIISEPKHGTQVFDAAMDRPVGWFKGTFRQFNAPEAVLMNAYGMRKGGIWTGYRNVGWSHGHQQPPYCRQRRPPLRPAGPPHRGPARQGPIYQQR